MAVSRVLVPLPDTIVEVRIPGTCMSTAHLPAYGMLTGYVPGTIALEHRAEIYAKF